MSGSNGMEGFIGKVVSVVTQDGRLIVGTLKGHDQYSNLIINNCHERVFSSDLGVESVPLGLYIIRGDNIAIVGEIDEEIDSEIDLDAVRAEPLGAVVY
eukprot:m.18013 g.18013  ORF g.18013 m.18013 type:complete len:99 (+) comp11361_c0_seq1:161-457(+)